MSASEEQGNRLSLASRRQVIIGASAAAFALTQAPKLALAQTSALAAAQFTPLVGTGFLFNDGDRVASLNLVDVKTYPLRTLPTDLAQPFSLVFRSPPDLEPLAGQIYEVQHPAIGKLSMFLTPISNDPSYYEAAFN